MSRTWVILKPSLPPPVHGNIVFMKLVPGGQRVGAAVLRNFRTILHNDCTSSHPHQQYGGVPFLHTCAAFIVCRLFGDGHSDWCGDTEQNLMKLKTFCAAKEAINKMKRQRAGGRKCFRRCNRQGMNLQNMQGTHTAQYEPNKQSPVKKGDVI